MASDRILLRDVIGGFAPGQGLRAALLLTYCFDGKWFEEGFVPDLFDRPVTTALILRDGNVVLNESPTVRYHRANANFSKRVFHSKLGLFIAEDRALVIVGSANLTRGGFERNLELASTFEVTQTGGPRSLFEAILHYVEGPLLNEVSGSAGTALRDAAVALKEVIKGVPKDNDCPHLFLHNYEKTLWEQILKELPHRYVSRLSIVSPFFEPNSNQPEDPDQEDAAGLLERAFKDLIFEPQKDVKPVAIYFQQDEGKTRLPIDKLNRWKDKVDCYQRSSTNVDEPRPLHGKLLVIEGSGGRGRLPYIITVYGSPNFTSAAFLSRPPEGNAEIAVLTKMPHKRNASNKVSSILHLDNYFSKVIDWGTLTHITSNRVPLAASDVFCIKDATLNIAERKLELTWQSNALNAVSMRILIEINGIWTVIATESLGDSNRLSFHVPEFAQLDNGGLLSIKSSYVRVQLVDSAGLVIATYDAPVNVDNPIQFCGLSMVGQLMAAIDQRIAFAGCGVLQTYREQQRFLEQHRMRTKGDGKSTVLTHQADLDRFFRNLHTGFRGMRSRSQAMPNSEFTFRRIVKDLVRWCQETILLESVLLSNECRLYLIDRLGRELLQTINRAQKSKSLVVRIKDISDEFQVASMIKQAVQCVNTLADKRLTLYAKETCSRLESVNVLLKDLKET